MEIDENNLTSIRTSFLFNLLTEVNGKLPSNRRHEFRIKRDKLANYYCKFCFGFHNIKNVIEYLCDLLPEKYCPYSIMSLRRDQRTCISEVFSQLFNTRHEKMVAYYVATFKPPSYYSEIRKVIKENFDEKRLALSHFNSQKLWEVIEFVFQKNEINLTRDVNCVKDQSGELTFSNTNCIMYSNEWNIFCFEISDFSQENIKEWDNALFIPQIIQQFNCLKNKYHTQSLSIIKHGNYVTLIRSEAETHFFYSPEYCLDWTNSWYFGILIGTLIQYSDSFVKYKNKHLIGRCIWWENFDNYQEITAKKLKESERRDKQFRKAFKTLTL